MLLQDSIKFAVEAHQGQFRKFDKSAYIKHPLSVMGMMTEFTSDESVLSACVLHDTVEDCKDVTLEVIHERFGEIVAGYVFYTTEMSKKSDGDRSFRKEIDRRHYSKGSEFSQNIKLLDMIDNIPTIVLFDPKFSMTYINEKLQLIQVLKKGNMILQKRALSLISDCITKIKE